MPPLHELMYRSMLLAPIHHASTPRQHYAISASSIVFTIWYLRPLDHDASEIEGAEVALPVSRVLQCFLKCVRDSRLFQTLPIDSFRAMFHRTCRGRLGAMTDLKCDLEQRFRGWYDRARNIGDSGAALVYGVEISLSQVLSHFRGGADDGRAWSDICLTTWLAEESYRATSPSQHKPFGSRGYAEVAFCIQSDNIDTLINLSTGPLNSQEASLSIASKYHLDPIRSSHSASLIVLRRVARGECGARWGDDRRVLLGDIYWSLTHRT